MAGKKAQFPFEVVLGLSDRFTAPIRRRLASVLPANVVKGFGSVQSGLGSVVRGLTKAGALAGGFVAVAGAGVAALAVQYAAAGDQIAKMASRTGLSVEALQEWKFAADRSGVSASEFDTALIAFTKRMGEARAGTGGLYGMLKVTSPAMLDALKATTSTSEAMDVFLAGLGDLPDSAQQMAWAAAAFGRSGTGMVNLAKEGAAGIRGLRDEARLYGLMSSRAAGESEEFVDAQTNLLAALSGFKIAALTEILPSLTALLERGKSWLISARPEIAAIVREFAAGLPEAIDRVVAAFQRGWQQAQPWLSLLQTIVQKIGPVETALLGLGTVMLGPVVLGLAQVTAGVAQMVVGLGGVPAAVAIVKLAVKGLWGLFMAHPLGMLVTAIGLVVAAFMKWDVLKEWVGKLWDGLKAGLQGIGDWIGGWWERMTGWLPGWAKDRLGISGDSSAPQPEGSPPPAAPPSEPPGDFSGYVPGRGGAAGGSSSVVIRFLNAPPGMVAEQVEFGVPIELDLGYSMGG